jgi:hypothetical protein
MEQDQQPDNFVNRLLKFAKDIFEKFKKTPYAMPAAAGLVGGAVYLLLVFLLDTCLVQLLPPFIMLAIFWTFDIKRARKLLIAGLLACVFILFIEAFFFLGIAANYEPSFASSNDAGLTLRNGVVDPAKGDAQTPFNFTIDVYVDNTSDIQEVRLLFKGIESNWMNESMSPVPGLINETDANNETYTRYSKVTTLSEPVYQFFFAAEVNGTWVEAWDYTEDQETAVFGPVYESDWEILKPMLYLSAMQVFLQYFAIYALLVGMIWWTRRARRMREKQLKEWEVKRKEAEAKAPKDDDAKVPSLSRAMGLESEGGDDSFVCSECGADVPSDAAKCPSCGEKFE